MSSPTPMKNARLASLALTWAFAVIACGTGLNAFAKFNQQTGQIEGSVPANTKVTINVADVRDTGIISCTVCLLTAILASFYILFLVVPLTYRSSTTPLATRTLRLQWMSMAFCWLFLFGAQTAFTLFFATRRGKVTAFVGPIQLPQATIDKLESALGVTSIYKDIWYLRLAAIFPWLTLLTLLISICVTLVAISRARSSGATYAEERTSGSATSIDEKRDAAMRENV